MGMTLFIVGIVGIVFLVSAILLHRNVHKAQAWPVAAGKVVSAEIKEHKSTRKQSRGFSTTTTYEPLVQYTYTVGGQTYTGKRIAYSGFQGARMAVENKLKQYSTGSPVQVHYNPSKPGDAVLELGLEAGKTYRVAGYIFLAAGLLALLAGGFSL